MSESTASLRRHIKGTGHLQSVFLTMSTFAAPSDEAPFDQACCQPIVRLLT